jgi:CPA1 family monovalent cation:H+ antiporter
VITVALLVSLAAIVIRLGWIFPAIHLTRWISSFRRPQGPPPPWRHGIIVGWTGMRGVVSLAAAMALPLTTASGEPFPGRDLIIFLSFAIIFVTLVGQGTTLSVVIRWLGVLEHAKESVSDAIARRKLAHAALEALDEVPASPETAPALEVLRQDYRRRMAVLPEEEEDIHKIAALQGHEDAYREVRLACIAAERRRLLKMRRERQIDDEAVLRLQWELDLEELRCEPGKV